MVEEIKIIFEDRFYEALEGIPTNGGNGGGVTPTPDYALPLFAHDTGEFRQIQMLEDFVSYEPDYSKNDAIKTNKNGIMKIRQTKDLSERIRWSAGTIVVCHKHGVKVDSHGNAWEVKGKPGVFIPKHRKVNWAYGFL